MSNTFRSCRRLIMFMHHFNTMPPVKSSFRRHFHAPDYTLFKTERRYYSNVSGQGKPTASNRLGSMISQGLVIFYFSILFDVLTKQDHTREKDIKITFFFLLLHLTWSFMASLISAMVSLKLACFSFFYSP